MLTSQEIKCAIVMIMRSSCRGDEAKNVSNTLSKLEKWYDIQVAAEAAAQQEEIEHDDERADQ